MLVKNSACSCTIVQSHKAFWECSRCYCACAKTVLLRCHNDAPNAANILYRAAKPAVKLSERQGHFRYQFQIQRLSWKLAERYAGGCKSAIALCSSVVHLAFRSANWRCLWLFLH